MKLKSLLLASASSFLLFNGVSFAQSVSKYGCYTDEHNRELERMNPAFAQSRLAIEQQIQHYLKLNSGLKTNGTVLKVPVVVHVVTQKGLNGISKAQVENGIQVLNEDFRRNNADKTNTRALFAPFAADLEIEFVLARLDPQGQPTEGINRVTTHTTNGPATRNDVKVAAPAWPTDKYFNVWLVNSINSGGSGLGTILGYAQFPGTGAWNTYGLVMMHEQWGKQGAVPGSTANSDGRTATHEAGHCFNLYHTFQGQSSATGCQGGDHTQMGDRVGDTPPSNVATFNSNCNNTQNSCNLDTGTGSAYTTDVVDQTENYMNYDYCQNMFTLGQRDRAHAALSTISQLQNLTSTNGATPSNAMVTGIDPSATVGPLVPQPYFGVANDRICAGGSINFTDASYNGNVTSWSWSFPGGTPATSTVQNPSISYNTPGVYDVTLTVGNGTNTRSRTFTKVVRVVPVTNLPSASNSQTYHESFEDSSFPNNTFPTHVDVNKSWELETTEVSTSVNNWERYANAAATGTNSLRLRNGSIDEGTVSTLITPNIDTRGLNTSVFVSFNLAFAKKPNGATPGEQLRLFVSTDCGETWTNRYAKTGNNLVTTTNTANSFIPTASDWRTERISIPSNILGNQIMFKLEAISDFGNTLYIDDFKLYSLLGTDEEIARENNIKVYPNPVTMQTGINFDLKTAEKVSVKIYDLIGNVVYQNAGDNFAPGSHTIGLHDKMKDFSAGMYMVELNLGNKIYNTKLIVQ